MLVKPATYMDEHTAPLRCFQRGQKFRYGLATLFTFAMCAVGQTPSNLTRAQALLEQQRPQQALDLLLTHPRSIDPLQLHLTLASAYTLLPDTVRAHEEFDAAVQLAPGQPVVHQQYGRALMVLGELPGARSELQRALVLDPGDAETLFALALLDGRENHPASASVMLARAIILTHDPVRRGLFYTTAGQMDLLSGDWPGARDAFERALALDSRNEPALSGLGNALEKLSLPTEAAAALNHAVALDPSDTSALEHLGSVETTLGDWASASAAYARLNVLRPGDRSTLNHLVRAYTAGGRKDEAARAVAQLKVLVDGDVAVDNEGPELARINAEAIDLEQKGDYSGAERDYRRLVAADSSNLIFRRNLGLVLCRQGQWVEGLSELKKALALDPDDLDSQHALNAALSESKNQPQPPKQLVIR